MLLNGEVAWIWQAQEETGRLAQNKFNLVVTGFILFCLMTLEKKQKHFLFLRIQFALFLQHDCFLVLLLSYTDKKNAILD